MVITFIIIREINYFGSREVCIYLPLDHPCLLVPKLLLPGSRCHKAAEGKKNVRGQERQTATLIEHTLRRLVTMAYR